MPKRKPKTKTVVSILPMEYEGRGRKPNYILYSNKSINGIWTFVIYENDVNKFQQWKDKIWDKYRSKIIPSE